MTNSSISSTTSPPVRWGVLGCARVFERRMAPAFAQAGNAALLAIASRSQEKADTTARKHGIPRTFGSYDELLRDPEIEAVFIPLPNDLHAQWTLRALAAGKHVLCDKPAALSYADATRMAAAADAANLRLMEGFMYRHHPQHERIAAIVQSGEIGEPVVFRGVFAYPAERDPENIRWNAAQGGGSLLDTGVYPINAARFHFGPDEPTVVYAAAVLDSELGVDVHMAATLEWSDGRRTAVIESGFDQAFTSRYEIVGRHGAITAERAFQVGEDGITVTVRVNTGRGDETRTETMPHIPQYAREIAHFSECVRNPERLLWPGENGVKQARIVEAARRSLTEKRRVEIAEIDA